MDELIQLLPFIIVALTLLGRVLRRKKPRESEPEVDLEGEGEVQLPPWGNVATAEDSAAEPLPDFLQLEEQPPREPAPATAATEDSRPAPDTAPSKPIERPTTNQARPREGAASARAAPRAIGDISLTPQTFRQGIILREILGPPKSLQGRRPETEN